MTNIISTTHDVLSIVLYFHILVLNTFAMFVSRRLPTGVKGYVIDIKYRFAG